MRIAIAALISVFAGVPAARAAQSAGSTASDHARGTIMHGVQAAALSDIETPRALLLAARQALLRGEIGTAREALERAESRALSESVIAASLGVASRSDMVLTIIEARYALAARDKRAALALIDSATSIPDAPEPVRRSLLDP